MIAIVSGIGQTTLPKEVLEKLEDERKIETPFGNVESIKSLEIDQKKVIFLFRHGFEKLNLTAPFVNYRANIYALKEIGVERIISLNTVGAINPTLKIGDFIIPQDFVDFTKQRKSTFYENKGYGHIRMNPPFCPEIRKALIEVTQKYSKRTFSKGIYFCFEGPRLETASEINLAKYLGGDIVGMTLATEAVLARELEICYASLCFVINYAEGVYIDDNGKTLFLPENEKEKKDELPLIFYQILKDLINLIPENRTCPCKDAMLNYKTQKIINDDWHTWI
ncbi:MAG: MTAP family purine nucleoside phosphorylase [Minisyncoccia bacterium]